VKSGEKVVFPGQKEPKLAEVLVEINEVRSD
jgi:hypothetical protein